MQTKSLVKELLILTYKNLGYLPVNLDYNFDLSLKFSILSAIAQTSGREC